LHLYHCLFSSCYLFFFFFQAEDGIRDRNVTGVQTCALPISFSICSLKTGITDPLEFNTFPKRTATKFVLPSSFNPVTIISATRFVAPIIFGGLTALSVEIITKASTPAAFAASAKFFVPNILFLTASRGFFSIIGTCL